MASHLETIGESGFAAFRPIGELRGLADRALALGLSSCGRPVVRVVEHLEAQRRGEPIDADLAARDLLRPYHVVRLAAAEEAVAERRRTGSPLKGCTEALTRRDRLARGVSPVLGLTTPS